MDIICAFAAGVAVSQCLLQPVQFYGTFIINAEAPFIPFPAESCPQKFTESASQMETDGSQETSSCDAEPAETEAVLELDENFFRDLATSMDLSPVAAAQASEKRSG